MPSSCLGTRCRRSTATARWLGTCCTRRSLRPWWTRRSRRRLRSIRGSKLRICTTTWKSETSKLELMLFSCQRNKRCCNRNYEVLTKYSQIVLVLLWQKSKLFTDKIKRINIRWGSHRVPVYSSNIHFDIYNIITMNSSSCFSHKREICPITMPKINISFTELNYDHSASLLCRHTKRSLLWACLTSLYMFLHCDKANLGFSDSMVAGKRPNDNSCYRFVYCPGQVPSFGVGRILKIVSL